MRNVFLFCLLLGFCISAQILHAQRSRFSDYKPIDFTPVRIMPEDYRNKKFTANVTLTEFTSVMPDSLSTVFRSGRFVVLEVERPGKETKYLPILAKKTDVVEILSKVELPVEAKFHATVRRMPSPRGKDKDKLKLPEHYIEVHAIVVDGIADDAKNSDDSDDDDSDDEKAPAPQPPTVTSVEKPAVKPVEKSPDKKSQTNEMRDKGTKVADDKTQVKEVVPEPESEQPPPSVEKEVAPSLPPKENGKKAAEDEKPAEGRTLLKWY